jgi:proteasome lid subunit RPN8/RPN11
MMQGEEEEYRSYKGKLIKMAESLQCVKTLDNSIPLFRYIQYAQYLIQQSEQSRKQEDFENTFIYLTRFVNLFVNVIRKHNSSEQPMYRRQLYELKDTCSRALDQLEILNERLKILLCSKKQVQLSINSSTSELTDCNMSSTESSPLDLQCKIYINQRMIDDFLSYGFTELENKIEFCAILAGHFSDHHPNAIEVTHLLIPNQTGTGESVQAINEMQLFDYQMEHKLFTVGWVHTHPTQTAFLSAVDLRTQFSYQSLFPDSIAIVCAPSFSPPDNIGVFWITDMPYLQQFINKNPTFGTNHSILCDKKIYDVCKHVRMGYDTNLKYQVIDLREIK